MIRMGFDFVVSEGWRQFVLRTRGLRKRIDSSEEKEKIRPACHETPAELKAAG
jgi:hypothetical protein